jgi:ribonuclease R
MKKNRKKNSPQSLDPFFEREAAKYANPIPSREFILQFLEMRGETVYQEELIHALHINTPDQKEALRRRLIAMERSGQLIKTRRGGYGIADKMHLVCGTIQGHKDGFGFLVCADKSSHIFISARKMRSVFDGDKVLVRVDRIDARSRREGTIVEVLERNTEQVVGRLFVENNVGFVIPENRRLPHHILIPPGEEGTAKRGQMVVAQITAQPSDRNQPLGKIIEVLGEHMAPGMEVGIAVRQYNIPHKWPHALLKDRKSVV